MHEDGVPFLGALRALRRRKEGIPCVAIELQLFKLHARCLRLIEDGTSELASVTVAGEPVGCSVPLPGLVKGE